MNLNNDPMLQFCAFMADADNFIKDEEVSFAKQHFETQADDLLTDAGTSTSSDVAKDFIDVDALLKTAIHYSEEKKIELLQLLWGLSICDAELHPKEEILFYKISDALGISRRATIEITR